MAKLRAAERNALPSSAFIFPDERAFPIPDRAHAYDALRMAGYESEDRQEVIKTEVCRRFRIGCSQVDAEDRRDGARDEASEPN